MLKASRGYQQVVVPAFAFLQGDTLAHFGGKVFRSTFGQAKISQGLRIGMFIRPSRTYGRWRVIQEDDELFMIHDAGYLFEAMASKIH